MLAAPSSTVPPVTATDSAATVAALSGITRLTVSVPPPALDRLSVPPSATVSVPAASVPLPVLLVMLAPLPAVKVLVTLAAPAISSVLAPSAMLPLPAVALAPLTRSVPLPTVVPPLNVLLAVRTVVAPAPTSSRLPLPEIVWPSVTTAELSRLMRRMLLSMTLPPPSVPTAPPAPTMRVAVAPMVVVPP